MNIKTVMSPIVNIKAILEGMTFVFIQRELSWEMAKRDISNRYAGQVLGTAWTVGHPLFLTSLYAFIFTFVMNVRFGDKLQMPLDYTAYILSGIIPWMMSQDAMIRSCSAIIGNANLVKQVVFPLEALPVMSVLIAFVTQLVALLCFFFYTVGTGQGVSASWLLLPLILVLHVLFQIGLAFLLAGVTVFFRDLKELVQLFAVAGLFFGPIIYVPTQIPLIFQPIVYVNPYSYIIWCYRDILYYGRIEHPAAWIIVTVGSLVTFALGYRSFRMLKNHIGSVV